MPWNSTWPIGGSSVKTNKTPGLQNTQYIESTLNVDHYFNQSNDGKHRKVSMIASTTDPTAQNDSSVILFSKINTVGATSGTDLYLIQSKTDGSAGSKLKLSQYSVGALKTEANGYSIIPGQGSVGVVLMQWGYVVVNTDASDEPYTVTFPKSFQTGYVPWSIQMTLQCSGFRNLRIRNSALQVPTESGFSFGISSGSSGFVYWTAIGLAP